MRFAITLALAGLIAASIAAAEGKVVRKEVKKEDRKEAHKEAHDEAHQESKGDAKADAKAEARAEAKAEAAADVKVEVNGSDEKAGGQPGGGIDVEAFKRDFEKKVAEMKRKMDEEMGEAQKVAEEMKKRALAGDGGAKGEDGKARKPKLNEGRKPSEKKNVREHAEGGDEETEAEKDGVEDLK